MPHHVKTISPLSTISIIMSSFLIRAGSTLPKISKRVEHDRRHELRRLVTSGQPYEMHFRAWRNPPTTGISYECDGEDDIACYPVWIPRQDEAPGPIKFSGEDEPDVQRPTRFRIPNPSLLLPYRLPPKRSRSRRLFPHGTTKRLTCSPLPVYSTSYRNKISLHAPFTVI